MRSFRFDQTVFSVFPEIHNADLLVLVAVDEEIVTEKIHLGEGFFQGENVQFDFLFLDGRNEFPFEGVNIEIVVAERVFESGSFLKTAVHLEFVFADLESRLCGVMSCVLLRRA